jgi:DNA-binding NarL/FixJ family response regulator
VADDLNCTTVPRADHWPQPLRALPCVDAGVASDYFAALLETKQIELLPAASTFTLGSRAQIEQPDVILIATEGFTASAWTTSALREVASKVPTLLLADEVSAALRGRAARFHIRSTLPLDASTAQLLAAISATVAGLAVTFEQDLSRENDHEGRTSEDRRYTDEINIEPLTAREAHVLGLMARGFGNKEIATRLRISEHTAKFHVSSILGKLGAASRTEAVTIGMVRGLVTI